MHNIFQLNIKMHIKPVVNKKKGKLEHIHPFKSYLNLQQAR